MRQAVLHSNDGTSAKSLRSALAAAGFEVVEARTSADVLARMSEDRAHVVLLDVDDGDGSAYLTCRLLRERCGEQLPIILFSGERTTSGDRVVSLLLGADEYVVKPFDSSEVVARLRRLVARSENSWAGALPAERNDEVEGFDLTSREKEVMTKLLLGRTQSEIARELVISSNTVATHIQRILLKLGVHNRAQAVAMVARAGWLQRDLEETPAARTRDDAPRALREAD